MRLELLTGKNGISFERFLLAMEIPNVGRTVSIALGKKYSIGEFEEAVKAGADISKCSGLDKETDACIAAWFIENLPLWENMRKQYPITVLPVRTPVDFSPAVGGTALAGKRVAVTGKIGTMTRLEVENLIQSFGGIFSKSVTKATDLLVVGEAPGEVKQKKAKEYGTQVIDQKDFMRRIGR